MSEKNGVEIFNKRAKDYEGFSDWCRNTELYESCIEPLGDMLPSIKCLDLGGGSGWIASKNASDTGRNWTVLDISPEMGKFIKSPVMFVTGDAHSLPFADNEFGHVVIRSVLQFVEATAVLKQVHRILTPRGHVVVAQKIKDHQGDAPEWHNALHILRNPTSHQDWTLKELENTIKSAGFRLLNTRFVREHRSVDLERWISKDGTIKEDKLARIRQLITNPPPSVIKSTNQLIENGKLNYEREWAICIAKKESIKAPLTPSVFSMIVERETDRGKMVLLQKRKKRYEEPVYCGSWELPQGKLEKGSFAKDTIAQELKDETTLILEEVSSLTPIKNVQDPYFHDQTEIINPLICVRTSGGTDFMAISVIVSATGNPSSIDIDREYRWVSVNDIPSVLLNEPIYPLNRAMLETYLSTIDSNNSRSV